MENIYPVDYVHPSLIYAKTPAAAIVPNALTDEMQQWGIMSAGHCTTEDRAWRAQRYAKVPWKSGEMIGRDYDFLP